MQIIMKPGPNAEESARCIRRHLEAMGSPTSIKNGKGPVVVHTRDRSWHVVASLRNLPGIERVVTGSKKIDDTNVAEIAPLDSPMSYRKAFPASREDRALVRSSRDTIRAILQGEDPRFMAVVGPCSIHDDQAGLEYAEKLAELAEKVQERVFIVMRTYFEKPRTNVGWEGLIQDPNLDGSFNMADGIAKARGFLLRVLRLGLPCATEFVNPNTPQYIADLISLGAIGARAAEDQEHRRMASGLSMPVVFKNGTGGSVQLAVNGVIAAGVPHTFIGIDLEGRSSKITTLGNPDCFVGLRGSSRGTNYDEQSVKEAVSLLEKAGVCPRLMVDCSHDNSLKNHKLQRVAFEDIVDQRAFGNRNIAGAMLESNLLEGRQDLGDPKALEYGISITDACVGWEETESLVKDAYAELASIL